MVQLDFDNCIFNLIHRIKTYQRIMYDFVSEINMGRIYAQYFTFER